MGGGGRGERVSGSTARSNPEDRGGRGPAPEQQLCQGSGDLAIAQQLVYFTIAVSTAAQSS